MRALILRKQPYGESDLIIQFFLETGRVGSAFAAGARKSRKRFSHQFHPAGIYRVSAARDFEGTGLQRLHTCELESFYPALVENLELFTRWSMVVEWILADEGQGFDFLEVEMLMKEMAAHSSPWAFHRFFMLQMQVHGLLPRLDQCIVCENPLQNEAVFSMSEGGVGHPHCLRGFQVSVATLNLLRGLSDTKLQAQKFEAHALELDQIMVPFLSYHLGRALKAHRFFDQIAPQVQTQP